MHAKVSRRRFLKTAAGVAILTGLYTWRIEPTWIEFVQRDLPIRRLPPSLSGKTLVHLSDIPIGKSVADDYVADVFARVTALRPDIIIHTGDLISYHGEETID